MLCALLGGELASAGELAAAAGVGAATASAHLARLLDAGLVACEPRGRHRYYRLADAEVAHALEALALVGDRGTREQAWATPARAPLRLARSCYGHLAGRLGVGLLACGCERGWWAPRDERSFAVTDAGAHALDTLGLDGRAWQRRSEGAGRPVAYRCLDWSERRDHLAGALAVALLGRFVEQGWLRRRAGERALAVTPAGRAPLADWTGPLEAAAPADP